MSTDDYIKGKPKRVHTQGRVDMRSLVECILYFEQMGHAPRTISETVAMAVEGLAYLARINGKINHVQTANDAYRLLEGRNMQWKKSSRTHKQVMRMLSEEQLEVTDLQNREHEQQLERYKEEARKIMEKKARKGTGDGIAGLNQLPDIVVKEKEENDE